MDYGSHGLYFITICTKDRVRYFGEIEPTSVEPDNYLALSQTEIGQVATEYWLQIPEHFPFVKMDEFIIMPDHIHGILFIDKPEKMDWQPNKFGSQSQNLASIIRAYKSTVKRYANLNAIDFAWQPKYFDRVVRNEKEHQNIRQYIYGNPEKWLLNNGKDNENF